MIGWFLPTSSKRRKETTQVVVEKGFQIHTPNWQKTEVVTRKGKKEGEREAINKRLG